MAKKKDSTSIIKKGVTLLASVLVFVFMFLEMLAVKSKASILGFQQKEWSSEGISLYDLIFGEANESIRENLTTTNIVLWVAFVLAVVAIVAAALAFVMKKQGSTLARLSGGLLVLAMLALFIINFNKAEFVWLGTGSTIYVTNMTVLYFISLVISVVGLASAASLKK